MKPKLLLSLPDDGGKNYLNAFSVCGFDVRGAYLPEYGFCDALVLCGGGDISPSYYGEESFGSNPPDEKRDMCEMKLFERFYAMKKPVFGICRGMQVINVALGGSLYQHLPTAENHTYCSGDRVHEVYNRKGTFMHELFSEKMLVNSAHHQGVKTLGDGLFVMQSHNDKTVEGVFFDKIIGVQWHPERMMGKDMFCKVELLFDYFRNMVIRG